MDMTGVVNVIEGENSCRTGGQVGALTYSGILVDDFVPSTPGGRGWSMYLFLVMWLHQGRSCWLPLETVCWFVFIPHISPICKLANLKSAVH